MFGQVPFGHRHARRYAVFERRIPFMRLSRAMRRYSLATASTLALGSPVASCRKPLRAWRALPN